MLFNIEPYDLTVDETLFEFGIRAMATDTTKNGMDLLRKRLYLESQGKILRPKRQGLYDVNDEIKICNEKMENLEDHLILASFQPDRMDKIDVLISRFGHVHLRLKILDSKDKRELEQIKNLSKKVYCYLLLLNSVRQGNSNLEEALESRDFLFETSTSIPDSELSEIGLSDLFSIEEVNDESELSFSGEKSRTKNGSIQTFLPYSTYSRNQSFKASKVLDPIDYLFRGSSTNGEKALGWKGESAVPKNKFAIGEFGTLKYLRKCLE